jgi:hypothetical protein
MSTAPSDSANAPTVPDAPTAPPAVPTPPAPPAATSPHPPQRPAPPAPSRPPRDPVSRLFLAVSAVVLVCWFVWLSYAALTKSREPIVSHAQAAGAAVPVVAKVEADDKGAPVEKVTVIESLAPNGPAKDTQLLIPNLPGASGFTGAGEYLLLLPRETQGFTADGLPVVPIVPVVGLRRTDSDPVAIYRWTPDVAAQAKQLYRAKE